MPDQAHAAAVGQLVHLGKLEVKPDARNLLAVIYVQEGKTIRASLVWRELVRDVPDYQPARTNLALLDSQTEVVLGETAAVALPIQRPPSKPSTMRADHAYRHPK